MLKEKRTIRVEQRVFSSRDLARLGQVVDDSIATNQEHSHTTHKTFQAVGTDGVSFSADRIRDLILDDRLSMTAIRQISFRSWCSRPNASVSITLYHGVNEILNSVEVEGEDRSWVVTTADRIRTIVEAAQPQEQWPKKWAWGIKCLIAIAVGPFLALLYFAFVILFFPKPGPSGITELTKDNPLAQQAVGIAMIFAVSVCLGWIPAEVIWYRTKKLWPSIEFQIGPDHMLLEKQRKKQLASLWIIIVAPTIINVITGVLLASI